MKSKKIKTLKDIGRPLSFDEKLYLTYWHDNFMRLAKLDKEMIDEYPQMKAFIASLNKYPTLNWFGYENYPLAIIKVLLEKSLYRILPAEKEDEIKTYNTLSSLYSEVVVALKNSQASFEKS